MISLLSREMRLGLASNRVEFVIVMTEPDESRLHKDAK